MLSSMVPLLLSLQLLLLVSGSWALYGASVSFIPKETHPDGSVTVAFRYKLSHTSCLKGAPVWCTNGSCQVQDITKDPPRVAVLDFGNYDMNFTWCETEGTVTRVLPRALTVDMRMMACCWMFNSNSVKMFALLTHVDLGTRSDTGFSNRSPQTAILPVIRIPRNCPRAYKLLAYDPDGDQVKCRFAYRNADKECIDCQPPPGVTLIDHTCTLMYQRIHRYGAYAVQLVVFDIPNTDVDLSYSNTTTAHRPGGSGILSRIPLQFLLRVDYDVDSCQEADYLPELLPPTPDHGVFLSATVHQPLEIKIKAQAKFSNVSELLVSGPGGVRETMTGPGEFSILWTPREDEAGESHPLCFAAQGKNGSNVYQSHLRCVMIIVSTTFIQLTTPNHLTTPDQFITHDQLTTLVQLTTPDQRTTPDELTAPPTSPKTNVTIGNATVVCNETSMTVAIKKASVVGLHADHLSLSDPSCSMSSNRTHIFKTLALNTCGTVQENDGVNLIFKNEIVSFDKVNAVITRRHGVEIEVSCTYPKRANISQHFRPRKISYLFRERGFGKFSFQFDFFNSSLFRGMIDTSSYPIEVDLKEMIYMGISSTSSIPNTQLFVESCRATPTGNPSDPSYYIIIQDGCKRDPTLQIYRSSPLTFHFGMEAFKFIGLHDEVFISCAVILCEAGNNRTRCAQGCTDGIYSGHSRRKREAVLQTTAHYISQGPLRRKRSTDDQPADLYLNLNMVLIASCLLAAVAMVCAVIIYRTRKLEVKYQPFPSTDQ